MILNNIMSDIIFVRITKHNAKSCVKNIMWEMTAVIKKVRMTVKLTSKECICNRLQFKKLKVKHV